MMQEILRSFRHCPRSLVKRPGFSLAVILTFALGIGFTTGVYTLVQGILLRPLPYAQPSSLVTLWQTDARTGSQREFTSIPDFRDWEEQQSVFERIAAHRHWEGTINDPGRPPVRVEGGQVTGRFLSVLGVQPALGRAFRDDEEKGAELTLILSHAFWRTQFGGDPAVLGQSVALDGVSHQIIGVMPPEFRSPTGRREDCWVPLKQGVTSNARATHELNVYGRLKPGVTLAQAQAEMSQIMKRLEAAYPAEKTGRGVRVAGLHADLVRGLRSSLWMLMGAAGLVLLVAAVNTTNLFLARSVDRQREYALRSALGSGSSGLLAQSLAEGLFLVLIGGGVGLVLASALVELVLTLRTQRIPLLDTVQLDLGAFGFALLTTLIVGGLCSLEAARHAIKIDLRGALAEGGKGSSAGGLRKLLRRALVVTEVALATVLVISAGLLARSFYRLSNVPLGFEPKNVLTFDMTLPQSRYPFPSFAQYPKWPEAQAFLNGSLEKLRALPGVEVVSFGVDNPITEGFSTQITFDDRPTPPEGQRDEVHCRAVSPDYLTASGTRLLRGRSLQSQDGAEAPPVLLVNETLAKRYYQSDPLGKRISFWGRSWEIVGIVEDVRFLGPAVPAAPTMYPPLAQQPLPNLSAVIKTSGDPLQAFPAIQRTIWELDSQLALYNVHSLDELTVAAVALPRFSMQLMLLLAGVALFLAGVGIYALMSHSVAQRTAEIGIRLALGGERSAILRMVLRQGVILLLIGLGLGLALAAAASRLLSSLLFEIPAVDPLVFVGMPLLLGLVGFAACLVPSLRALRVAPVVALKADG